MRKNLWIIITVMLTAALLLPGCKNETAPSSDTIKYQGSEYVYLAYPSNVFYYDYNGNENDHFEEADGIYPIESPQWDMIWNGGDLYCIKDSADTAISYYSIDDNYNWYILIDSEDVYETDPYPIEITESELDVIYDLEVLSKDTSAFFEEFEAMGSILKISKDGIVRGTLSIAKYDGKWYWKSEIIDESQECDGTWAEYIQPLPESLQPKIQAIENEL